MIYVVAHKPVSLPAREGYQPIQVGFSKENFPGFIRDDAGDSIAEKNASFCELTALYWVWKNTDDDCKGLVHYRRYFGRRPFSSRERDILTYGELKGLLEGCDALAARPAHYHVNAREQLLMECCDEATFGKLEQTVARLAPDYLDAFRAFFAQNRAAQYNMLFCRRERFDGYCAWLFPLLFALEAQVDLSRANDYQKRLYGFLSERLMNVWLMKNGLRVKYLPVVSTEYSPRDHWTYFRRDVTNELRFRLSRQ